MNARKLSVRSKHRILLAGLIISFCATAMTLAASHRVQKSTSAQAKKPDHADSITGIVVDSSDRPVPGVTVQASPAVTNDDDFRFTQQTKADANGRFVFEGLSDKAFFIYTNDYLSAASREIHVPGDYVFIRIERGGVVTGRVIDTNGQPVINVPVRLQRIKRADGLPLGRSDITSSQSLLRSTDDRGIYRIWNVPPGTYLVAAGGKNDNYKPILSQYDQDARTYYPSSTLFTATQIAVNSGQEVSGIDIRYRGEAGFAITGVIKPGTPASKDSSRDTGASLFTATGTYFYTVESDDEEGSFEFKNLSDGEYRIVGYELKNGDVIGIAPAKSLRIKGADVGEITLSVVPLATISGRVTLDMSPATNCKAATGKTLEEVVLSFKSSAADDPILSVVSDALTQRTNPTVKGEFSVKRVAGNYRVDPWLPSDDWYVSSMTIPASPKPIEISASGLTLRSGQKASNLNIAIKNGAAGISGQVAPKVTGSVLPESLHVYLIPADESRLDDGLQFADGTVQSDGTFVLENLAPGSYKILTRPISKESAKTSTNQNEEDSPINTHEGRSILMREAKDVPVIELHSCERQTGLKMKY